MVIPSRVLHTLLATTVSREGRGLVRENCQHSANCRWPECGWRHGLARLMARWLSRMDIQSTPEGAASLLAEAGHILRE